jgi:hypothetical protein
MIAEISAEGCAVIIAAIFLGFGKVLEIYLVNRKMNRIDGKVDVIHQATNGMQKAMLKSANDEGFREGVQSEKDKPSPHD